MLSLGSVKTIITENVKNGRIQFDMHGFLAGVILADLNLAGERLRSRPLSLSLSLVPHLFQMKNEITPSSRDLAFVISPAASLFFVFLLRVVPTRPAASPFLLGRALWAASRFTAAMSPELIQQFLQATVSGLHDSQPPSVRISAVRAIWG